jgi:AraC family transcriptional regulator
MDGSTSPDVRIAEIRRLLDASHGRVSLQEMARHAGLSVSRFCHLFRAATGMAPARYSMRARMLWARSLLADNSLSVKEIAAQAGFDDESHFARAFRKAFGVNPSDKRNCGHDLITDQ